MGEYKTKWAFFTIPEFEKEQDWLRKQHNAGWSLVGVTFPGLYRFRRCEPKDVIYQLDYNQEARADKAAYIQLFSDCDWEYILDYVGYSYFRKAAESVATREESIFSDDASKLDMARRVFKGRMIPLVVLFFCVIIPQLFIQFENGFSPLFYLFSVLLVVYLMIFYKFGTQYMQLKDRTGR